MGSTGDVHTECDESKRAKSPFETATLILALILLITVSAVYIRQKIAYYNLIVELNDKTELFRESVEASRKLTSRLEVLNSPRRILQIARQNFKLQQFNEDEVVYLRME